MKCCREISLCCFLHVEKKSAVCQGGVLSLRLRVNILSRIWWGGQMWYSSDAQSTRNTHEPVGLVAPMLCNTVYAKAGCGWLWTTDCPQTLPEYRWMSAPSGPLGGVPWSHDAWVSLAFGFPECHECCSASVCWFTLTCLEFEGWAKY